MEFILRHIRRSGQFKWLYAANLFFALNFFLVHFINSSFLGRIIPEELVGLIFAIGSFLALLALGTVSLVLEKLGNYKTVLWATAILFTCFVGLTTQTHPGVLLVFFALSFLFTPVILFNLDIFLETYQTSEASTGNTRGMFLSIATGASMFAAAVAGWLAGPTNTYSLVYFVASLCLIPFFLVVIIKFSDFVDPRYHAFSLGRTLHAVYKDSNIKHVCVAQFLMRFFFSWMVVYMPLYLHSVVGFTWPEVGLILAIMLIPYVLIEVPAGIVADRWLGEKELLVAGFVIVILSTIPLSFITSTHLVVWAALLFMTRVGAALIEIMTESYFFKHTTGDDADSISFFRMQRPLAYVIGPLSASLLLFFLPLSGLWLILAAILTIGIYSASRIVDTR